MCLDHHQERSPETFTHTLSLPATLPPASCFPPLKVLRLLIPPRPPRDPPVQGDPLPLPRLFHLTVVVNLYGG